VADRRTNRGLVRAIRTSLPPSMEWTEVDAALLALAERQARDLDALESRDDLPAIREARFQRLALTRIIGQLDLPHNARSTVLRAQKAAQGRWRGNAAS
jgi:hypothetical protein